MTNKQTGGPAFPPMHDPDTHPSGMTLRDYFAAKAMQSLVQQRCYPHDCEVGRYAYVIADLMLKAREA